MKIDWWILLAVYVLATGILIFFIPKIKIRLAVVAFLFKQLITFFTGLWVVELGLIEYPVRLFPSINRTSFTFEFYAFPSVCAIFNVWYPSNRNTFTLLAYYVGFTSALTIVEIAIEKYTELIVYIHWDWYISWISICLTFFLSRLFCVWFFAKGRA